MRIHVAGALVAAGMLTCSSAIAADLASPPEVPAAVAYDWTGFYVGVHGGYGFGDANVADPAIELFDVLTLGLTGDVAEYDIDGFLGGVQAGAQIQHGMWVLGVEGDIAWSGVEGDDELFNAQDIIGIAEPDDFRFGLQTDIEWLATFRARAGVTFDRFLVYATGGLALADINSGFSASSNGFSLGLIDVDPFSVSFEDSKTHLGWTAGAGVEAMITENISVKAEYLYVDLGEEEYDVTIIPSFLDVQGDVDIQLHTVKVGLNYRF
jgi:outer membrane immunogenic protein